VLCGFSKGQALMLSVSRDVVALIRIFTSCLTAAFLIFFISSLSGEDLIKNNSFIEELDRNLLEIAAELESGIEDRINQLGEVPAINPYKKFYCAEFAKEIHEVSYLTEKQKILFDSFNVRDFESKSKRLVKYSENADIQSLMNELEIVKRELKNSVNLIDKRRKKLVRQRTAYIILFFVLWIVIYFYYSRGFIRR
jgi:Fe2+ transport system protein B